MRKLEKIVGLLAIVSVILKFLLIPYSGISLSLSILTLAVLYYPLGFAFFNRIQLRQILKKESYNGKSTLKIIGAVGVGLALSILCIGILFKLQHYPFSLTILKAGMFLASIASLIVIVQLLKTKNSFYKKILNRVSIIGGISLLLLFVSDLNIVKIQYRNHPEYIKAYEAYLKNPDNEEIQKKLGIESHKATMSEQEFDEYRKSILDEN
ncbi:hypothetical protein [Labilibaculum manganireducens]|uniref:hypothetical protein n=1 Tax=Labilibaculum manganireducens TaxID=1940525 RepID=UPI0029F4BEA5|nr:hypothetical protein [Labilibaculum manganireducens]